MAPIPGVSAKRPADHSTLSAPKREDRKRKRKMNVEPSEPFVKNRIVLGSLSLPERVGV